MIPTEAALEKAFGVEHTKQPTATFSFKTRKGNDEFFLSLPFPVSVGNDAAMEQEIDRAANLVKAAVMSIAGIPWSLSEDGRPVASLPAQGASQAAAQMGEGVQQRQQRNGGGGAGANQKILGQTEDGEDVRLVPNGRFGPFVTDGKTIAKVPESCPLEAVTLEKALRWIAYKIERQAGAA